MLVWKRKVSRYVKRGKHGQVWDYYKMGVPRELATREVFVTKWGNGFLAMPSIEDVREYAFAGFWDGNRLFLPSSEPSRDYMICVGKAGPYNIYNIDKFTYTPITRSLEIKFNIKYFLKPIDIIYVQINPHKNIN